ncbi:MAG: hypothetical protein KDD74_00335 [Anaerolineales bacterium]|nr:hypothetical protein [Anaerolineales bacterium]
MKKALFGTTMILLATLACGLVTPAPQETQQGLETIVAATLEAIASEPTPLSDAAATENQPAQTLEQLTPDGTPFNSTEVSFFIPNGVANDAVSGMTTNVEYPYINPGGGDMPQHLVIDLNLYAATGSTFSPRIMIFRADEYSQYSDLTAGIINALQTLQYAEGQTLPQELDADFMAQIHGVSFQNGQGVRYISQIFQNFSPVNNAELFYYYQGVTSDGKYLVQATLPINTAFLPADSNPNSALPTDGIVFNADDFQGYLSAVAQKLNTTETYNFNPFIDALDEMIASMQITGF